MSIDSIEAEYKSGYSLYDAFCREISTQLNELLSVEGISLASPLEYRVKSWSSIREKVERDQLDPKELSSISDLAGVRTIAVFRRDVERICRIVETNFQVLDRDDTFVRLQENQFGYGSIHYQIKPMSDWGRIPTLRKFQDLLAEIQVRTGSQHIWAAASHILQYKKEAHVPIPLRRSINRAAALLETVDLEFERLLLERERYAVDIGTTNADLPLDTDLVRKTLDAILPGQNKEEPEDYAEILDDLLNTNVRTTDQLEQLLKKNLEAVMRSEKREVKRCQRAMRDNKPLLGTSPERTARGVYFTHVGLTRRALREEYGDHILIGSARRTQR